MEYVGVGCASLIGWVFLASAMSKLRNFGEFTRSLPALAPVRPGQVRALAMTVVAAEVAVPILLLFPAAVLYGFALAGALLTGFTAAIGTALRRGRRTPCRCFGASSTPLGLSHLVRNVILIISALAGGLAPAAQSPQAAGLAVAIAAGLLGAILIVAMDDIAFLFARTS
jgi:Methylamine utilisation protein MauE